MFQVKQKLVYETKRTFVVAEYIQLGIETMIITAVHLQIHHAHICQFVSTNCRLCINAGSVCHCDKAMQSRRQGLSVNWSEY